MVKNNEIATKETYARCLLSKLDSMLEENQKARTIYDSLKNKQNGRDYFEFTRTLSEENKNIFYRGGRIHSKAAISRVRIELNKVLIEIERGM